MYKHSLSAIPVWQGSTERGDEDYMRTRILNKMTAKEVEDYLARGGDTIFVAVGVIECHSAMPVEAEQILPESFAVTMAEKADGLALINLPYFFPGGTIVSHATVQVSVRESIDYLMMISHSLVAQGFRKIFFVSGHGPARLYIDPVCRDFFQETKVHVCHLNVMNLLRMVPNDYGPMTPSGLDFSVGAYEILKRKDELPVDPDAPDPLPNSDSANNPTMFRLQKALRTVGAQTSMYYADPEHHVPCRAFRSTAERDEVCANAAAFIRACVDRIDFDEIKAALEDYEIYVKELSKKYPRIAGRY